jgi:hypothetical protein
VAKLKARYPGKFDALRAIQRDKAAELLALSGNPVARTINVPDMTENKDMKNYDRSGQ